MTPITTATVVMEFPFTAPSGSACMAAATAGVAMVVTAGMVLVMEAATAVMAATAATDFQISRARARALRASKLV